MAWEIDLWGRIRRTTEVARAQFLASGEARRGVVVTLEHVATGYFQLLALDRLAIAHESAETYRRTRDVFMDRYLGGTDTKISTSRAEADLQGSLASIAALKRQISEQENAICVLLGINPGPIERGMPLVDQTTPSTPEGLTTDLLRRRPDIRQAEQTMISANAAVGVAVANFFPTVGLSARTAVRARDRQRREGQREPLEHRRQRQRPHLPGWQVAPVVSGAAGVLGPDDRGVPRHHRAGLHERWPTRWQRRRGW